MEMHLRLLGEHWRLCRHLRNRHRLRFLLDGSTACCFPIIPLLPTPPLQLRPQLRHPPRQPLVPATIKKAPLTHRHMRSPTDAARWRRQAAKAGMAAMPARAPPAAQQRGALAGHPLLAAVVLPLEDSKLRRGRVATVCTEQAGADRGGRRTRHAGLPGSSGRPGGTQQQMAAASPSPLAPAPAPPGPRTRNAPPPAPRACPPTRMVKPKFHSKLSTSVQYITPRRSYPISTVRSICVCGGGGRWGGWGWGGMGGPEVGEDRVPGGAQISLHALWIAQAALQRQAGVLYGRGAKWGLGCSARSLRPGPPAACSPQS